MLARKSSSSEGTGVLGNGDPKTGFKVSEVSFGDGKERKRRTSRTVRLVHGFKTREWIFRHGFGQRGYRFWKLDLVRDNTLVGDSWGTIRGSANHGVYGTYITTHFHQ
jgi:hypothetical protein